MLSSIYHGVLFHLQSELHIELMELIYYHAHTVKAAHRKGV